MSGDRIGVGNLNYSGERTLAVVVCTEAKLPPLMFDRLLTD